MKKYNEIADLLRQAFDAAQQLDYLPFGEESELIALLKRDLINASEIANYLEESNQ